MAAQGVAKQVLMVRDALDLLKTSVGDLGLIQVLMLLTIFENDGITQHELAEELGLNQGTVSKNCRRFAAMMVRDPRTGQDMYKGMDLITLKQQYDSRRKGCFLTVKGKGVKRNLYKALRG